MPLRTPLCDRLGIEYPIVGFTPSEHVAAAISRAGGLGVLGREVGSQWQTWRHHLEYVDYVGAVVLVAAIVYLIVRRRRRPSDPEADGTPTGSAVGGTGAAVDAVSD